MPTGGAQRGATFALRPRREQALVVLQALTSLVLAAGFLLPASVLFLFAGFASMWVVDGMVGLGSEDSELLGASFRRESAGLVFAAAPVVAAACTQLARAMSRLQVRRSGRSPLPAHAEAAEPKASRSVRLLRHLYGAEAWRSVFHVTVIGAWGLLSGLAVLVLIAFGVGLPLGLLGLLAALAAGVLAPGQVEWAQSLSVVVVSPLLGAAGVWLAGAAQRVEESMTYALLVDSPEVRARRRMGELRETRMRMVDAAEAERRRIERDLHDGAQQQLLAVTMSLGRARGRLARAPEQAERILDQAHGEAKEAMASLREVARGLHPRVLSDEGLAAALPVAAGRCPVRVGVYADLDGRPSPRAEGVAYYVACEALANIAKHAEGATAVEVRAERAGDRGETLRLTVRDDGRGGADPDSGTGLYGLWDRVRAVDGRFHVDSPAGGPTVLSADIPWEA